MSDNRPIGIFDSGLGGLTVAKEILRILPNESIIYIGDTARVPYGNRSPETVTQFSSELVSFLINQNVKAVVVACATASSVALESLRHQYSQTPIYGVIDAAAKAAAETSKNHQIGIIGTRGTISSGTFEKTIKLNDPDALINTQACPLFVPLIEEGIGEGKILEDVVEYYLKDLPQTIDTLVLGCTHYPIIAKTIQRHLPSTKLINPGESVATALKQELEKQELQSTETNSIHTFYATDITENFERVAQLFLGMPLSINLHRLEN